MSLNTPIHSNTNTDNTRLTVQVKLFCYLLLYKWTSKWSFSLLSHRPGVSCWTLVVSVRSPNNDVFQHNLEKVSKIQCCLIISICGHSSRLYSLTLRGQNQCVICKLTTNPECFISVLKRVLYSCFFNHAKNYSMKLIRPVTFA